MNIAINWGMPRAPRLDKAKSFRKTDCAKRRALPLSWVVLPSRVARSESWNPLPPVVRWSLTADRGTPRPPSYDLCRFWANHWGSVFFDTHLLGCIPVLVLLATCCCQCTIFLGNPTIRVGSIYCILICALISAKKHCCKVPVCESQLQPENC